MAATQDYKPGDVPLEEQDDRRLFCKFHYKGVLLLLIPILLGPILAGDPLLVCRFIYISLCLYLIYILNLMARGAIAFLYITFIPIAGIAGSGQVSTSYYTDLIFLVFGAIFMGVMMDSSGLSERLGMCVIGIVGGSLRFLQIFLTLGVFLLAYLVNPTMAAAFWMKVSQAVITEYDNAGIVRMYSEERPYEPGSNPYPTRSAIGIYITCCYAATLAGSLSPFVNPNGVICDGFTEDLSIEHLMLLMLAPTLLGLCVMIFWIQILFLGLFGGFDRRNQPELEGNRAGFRQTMADKRQAMGPWTTYPILVFVLILITFVLTATRRPRVYSGWDHIEPGIESGLSVPAIGMAILFFAIPANYFFCRYYVCRTPQKEGTSPSLLAWKAVNTNTPWADLFMLGAAFSCVFCAQKCGMNEAIAGAMTDPEGGTGPLQFVCGALYGTLLTSLSPATAIAKIALPTMAKAGGNFALPFATALHNQYLLPVSAPSNTIVAGWGNIRPYQFLMAGSVLAIFMFLTIAGFTALLGSTALPNGFP
ncbi:protein I'm not dead yet [Drosophila rhopaloa]|uniref:Protein I'm not dead yet n=1 Tax=Drosophila rhopaloa TaxID=1041015 RepID=A0A6P4E7Z1_DRORH|nr:protein I'm not dead yet [Drosophila rhopaloa]